MTDSETPISRSELVARLGTLLGSGKVSTETLDRESYSRDLWPVRLISERHGEVAYLPDIIVWPETVGDIVTVLEFANKNRVPVIPYGAGSGVCGGSVPAAGGITLDLKRMDKIVSLDESSMTVTVQAGAIGQTFEDHLNRSGYTLGHFPASMWCSTVGGWLSTRSAGQLSTKYGKIEEMVLSLKAVLPTGTEIEVGRAPRSSTGPDLKQLLIGAEGTLGVIHEATLRIWPCPKLRVFRGFAFPDVPSGLEAIRIIMQSDLVPAGVRLYDEPDTTLTASQQGFEVEGCLLVLLFEGRNKMARLESELAFEICREQGGKDLGEAPGKHWWEHRYDVSFNLSRIMPNAGMIVDTIEVAATWSRIVVLYDELRAAIQQHMPVMAHFSHAYRDGASIYFSIFGSAEDGAEGDLYRNVWDAAMNACTRVGGTISHHHGIGMLKAAYMEDEYGNAMDLLRAIKKTLDPNNIMNPGKLGL